MSGRPHDGRKARVCVAQIGAAHGIRGEVRLRPFTQDPADVGRYGALETEDGARRFEIEALRPAKDHFVVRFAGVSDRTGAEALTNLRLYVSRDSLPEVEDADTFYHADLVGLIASDAGGAEVGTVTAVHDFGAGAILEITPAAGGAALLLSFTQAVVPDLDLEGGRMTVVPPSEGAPD